MIYPIGERARGAYSGAQSLLRLRSPEKDSGSGDQSAVETLHEFSYMFPPNMGVIVFCTSPGGWLPYQANRFSSTNRGVAIETREMTYLFNSRTADSFLASALCGGAIGKPAEFRFSARAYTRHRA